MPPPASAHTIETPSTGRYLVRDAPAPAPMLVGFHGYGESADRHLDELARLPGAAGWCLVSIQGLHRFYERRTGQVVASWMTSQDRDRLIADNVRYVRAVVETVARRGRTDGRLVYCGFSQGVAMAYRAAARGSVPAAGILALAGDVPPELRADGTVAWPRVLIGRGVRDTYYTAPALDADLTFLSTTGCPLESVVFDGGHEWHQAFRDAAGRLLADVSGRV